MRKFALIMTVCFFSFAVLPCAAKEIKKVGIIGGGGAGLTTAWLLDETCEVTLFEKKSRLGGHANTIDIEVEGKTIEIDAGFEFFSDHMYPTFNRFLKVLDVKVNKFPLTYTFYHVDGSDTVVLPPVQNGYIAWESLAPSNIFDLFQFKFLLDRAKYLVEIKDTGITLQQFVDNLPLTDSFKHDFLYPFLAAGWGVSSEVYQTFAAYNVLKYLVMNQPSGLKPIYWNEIEGGTRSYIQAVAKQLEHTHVKLSSKIRTIAYEEEIYKVVEEDGTVSQFDHLILATNAFEARDLLKDIPEALDIRTILDQIEYSHTTIAVHGDTRFMPEDKDDWSVANVRYDGKQSAMTFHKSWEGAPRPVFRSWLTFDVRPETAKGSPLPDPLYSTVHYWHPKVNLKYFQTQKAVQILNGNRHLWFAGVYTEDVDSHESVILSAIRVAKALAPHSTRLYQLKHMD